MQSQTLASLGTTIGPASESDAELAASIFADGRRRRAAGQTLTLADYLRVLPDLASRELPLDAAIGICVGRHEVSPEERRRRAEQERQRHPELSDAIDLALCLDQLLGSAEVHGIDEGTHTDSPDPTDLGPTMEDGRARYIVRRVIGRGTSSVVYEAEDRLLGAEARPTSVAIKLFHRAQIDSTLFERTVAEARRASSIQHPGVVRVLDVGRQGSGVYIVQEFVAGQTLDSWLLGPGRLAGVPAMVLLMRDVASALATIHAAGIWHRDLKPANVMVSESGQIKIVDFGASRTRSDDRAAASDSSRFGGTLAFMAPEQFKFDQQADSPAADIYSLGAMIYWAFVGSSPHGKSKLSAIAALAEGTQPADLSESLRRAGANLTMRRIVLRALAVQPRERYASADRLAADLDAWLAHHPIEWQRPGPIVRTRLFVVRRPFSMAMLGLCAILGSASVLGWMSAARAKEAAQQSKLVAEVERAKSEAEARWKAEAAEQISKLLKGFASTSAGLEAQVMTSLWVLEWVHGPMLLESPELLDKMWETRIDVLEGAQHRLASKGNADSVTAQMMLPSLALWHLRAGHTSEAEGLLASSQAYWSQKTDQTDPWMQSLQAMTAAAKLQRHLDEMVASSSPLSDSQQLQIQQAADDVKSWATQYSKENQKNPIRSLLRETLTRAKRAGVIPPR